TAGTAKTFYSLAVGLHKILEESEPIYRRILISRPNVQFDEEIGFLLGDPEQIDHPLLDARTNGLSYAAEKMKDSPLCWQITMETDECERSELAWDASQRM
ncbi:MAG TPA: PhoH family protein, partial [Candidatus Ozemobacteraceae bacterium]|nr:PhoH family protein [Candidatus Ozemobacteraceae bacterium]